MISRSRSLSFRFIILPGSIPSSPCSAFRESQNILFRTFRLFCSSSIASGVYLYFRSDLSSIHSAISTLKVPIRSTSLSTHMRLAVCAACCSVNEPEENKAARYSVIHFPRRSTCSPFSFRPSMDFTSSFFTSSIVFFRISLTWSLIRKISFATSCSAAAG